MKRTMGVIWLLAVAFLLSVPAVAVLSDEAADADNSSFYYDQLSQNGKKFYDVVSTAPDDADTMNVALPVTLSLSSSGSDISMDALKDLIKKDFEDACVTIRVTDPLAIWLWTGNVVSLDPDYVVTGSTVSVSSVSMQFVLSDRYMVDDGEGGTVSNIDKMLEELNEAVGKFSTKSTSLRDKILDINNFVTNMATYDPNVGKDNESPYSHDAYGALVESNHYAVCDGYSRAFMLICEKNGIETVMVLGTAVPSLVNHAWNYVKMDDNKWYGIDVTWNDNSDANQYFLKGGDTFFTKHQQGVYLESGDLSSQLNTPVLSASQYDSVPASYDDYIVWGMVAVIVVIISYALYRSSRPERNK